MATDVDVEDAYVRRALRVLRVAEGEAVQASRVFKPINDRIIATIAETPEISVTSVERMQRIANQELERYFLGTLPDELQQVQTDVIAREAQWHGQIIQRAIDDEDLFDQGPFPDPLQADSVVAGASGSVTIQEITRRASTKAYQGKTFSKHFRDAYPRQAARLNRTLRTAVVNGDSIAEATGKARKVLNRMDRDTRTLVRSFVMHNAVEAKESVLNINRDLVEAIRWVSTLDSRTTPLICGVRDGLLYTLDGDPIDHGEEWETGPGRIHWNCRSTSAPVIKGIKNTASPRPSIGPGENYTRGDNKNQRGRVQLPTKPARDKGIYQAQIRTTRTKYEPWLREQSKKNIDFVADILGSKDKARAFRDGKVTLSQIGAQSPVTTTQRSSAL